MGALQMSFLSSGGRYGYCCTKDQTSYDATKSHFTILFRLHHSASLVSLSSNILLSRLLQPGGMLFTVRLESHQYAAQLTCVLLIEEETGIPVIKLLFNL
jgi:hypothetical protein